VHGGGLLLELARPDRLTLHSLELLLTAAPLDDLLAVAPLAAAAGAGEGCCAAVSRSVASWWTDDDDELDVFLMERVN
jgi:hypothetical protein